MKRIIQLKPGHYLELDCYRKTFLHYMRPQFSPTSAIFFAFTFVLALTYAFAAPYASSDSPTDQPVKQAEGRSGSYR